MVFVLQVEKMLEETFGHILFASLPNNCRVCPRYFFSYYSCFVMIKIVDPGTMTARATWVATLAVVLQ